MKSEIYSGGETVCNKQLQAAMHKVSHTITKPKIRIIHIVAPEIIKTDVENFRDLVQSLTGKSAAQVIKKRKRSSSSISSRKASRGVVPISSKLWTNMHNTQQQDHHLDYHQGLLQQLGAQRILKKEPVQDILLHSGSGSGDSSSSDAVFSDGFGDHVTIDDHYNSFIQDFSIEEYPNLLPFKSSQMNLFGEMHLC